MVILLRCKELAGTALFLNAAYRTAIVNMATWLILLIACGTFLDSQSTHAHCAFPRRPPLLSPHTTTLSTRALACAFSLHCWGAAGSFAAECGALESTAPEGLWSHSRALDDFSLIL